MAKKIKKPEPDECWMAWSPYSNFLPQAASVSRAVCAEMIWQRFDAETDAVPVKVRITPIPKRKSRKR